MFAKLRKQYRVVNMLNGQHTAPMRYRRAQRVAQHLNHDGGWSPFWLIVDANGESVLLKQLEKI